MSEPYTIEFYGLAAIDELQFVIVDEGVALHEARQIMANWYFNMSEQETRFIYMYQEDKEDFWDITDDEIHGPYVGAFVVRDSRNNVVDRVTSDIVRHSPEMEGADPIWFERRDPDYERKQAEKEAMWERERIRRMESAPCHLEFDDVPF